jgi:endonuclease/exonuclease/phosphatase family metal-dependent hydrolase
MKLRLMTYNVHRCVGTDRALDVERVAEVIAAENPDVVALQELDVLRRPAPRRWTRPTAWPNC